MSEKVTIEIVSNNGQPQYAITKCNDNTLNQLGEVAVSSMGTYIKYGNNPQGLISQAMPLLQQFLGGANGGGGGMNLGNMLGSLMGGSK